MAENFRPLSDLPECDDLKEKKISDLNNLLSEVDFHETNAGDFSDIDDPDVQSFLKGNIDACKNSTKEELIVLKNIYKENQDLQVDGDISEEEHLQNLLDLQKSKISYKQIDGYTETSGEITHKVEKGETLGGIIQKVYGYTKWSEIADEIEKAKAYNLSKGIVLHDKVKQGQKINLFIEDIDVVTKRLAERDESERLLRSKKNKIELNRLTSQREIKIQEIESTEGKVPIFQFKPKDFENRLDNNLYSGELQNDAFDIYKSMKNTKGVQIIGKYRNKNGEVENIILGDNKGKNIYMELDESYTWDDIDSGVIDNISSQQELESVMVKLLDLYERENREIH